MDAVNALQQVERVQQAFQVIAVLMLTAYLYPRQAVVNDNQEFDFIVVGAGSAGVVLAYRLAECNFQVLLIDAGGDPTIPTVLPALFPYTARTELDWNYTNVRRNDMFQCHRTKTVNLTIGHVLGGSSSINYMFYVRGCRGDYDNWAKVVNDPSWGYDGMLPYFTKSERLKSREILSSRYRKYHGTQGYLGVTRESDPQVQKYLEAFGQAGKNVVLDINGDINLGYTRQLYTIADGVRQSTVYSLLAGYNNPNLKVLKRTFVTRILFDDKNNAIGVSAINEYNKEITLQAKNEVIVSAGALNTPRLLMTSGIGPEEHLKSFNISVKKDLPVGKNLQDHVPMLMSFKMEESNEPPPPVNPHKFPSPSFTGYVSLNRSEQCPTYQAVHMLVPAGSKAPMNLCVFNFGLQFDICQNLYEAGKNRNTLFVTLSILHPKSRGEVLLRSANPRDEPLINVGYLENSEDLEQQVDSVLDYVQILNTTYFRSVNSEMVNLQPQLCEGLTYMSRDWWRCYVRCVMVPFFHFSGTSALGSVVDHKLRVFGVGRLRVIDASVMPMLIGGNTNAPVIAIAEKGADIIKKEYGIRSKSFFSILNNKFGFGTYYGYFK